MRRLRLQGTTRNLGYLLLGQIADDPTERFGRIERIRGEQVELFAVSE